MELNRDSRNKNIHTWVLHFSQGWYCRLMTKDSLYTKWSESTDYTCWEKTKLALFLTLCTKIKYRGITNLHVKSKSRKLPSGNIREYFHEHRGKDVSTLTKNEKKITTWIKLGIYTSKYISNTQDQTGLRFLSNASKVNNKK